MFNYISKCFSSISKRDSRDVKLLMLGIDNAGKSTIINDLKGEPKESTVPTIGFSSAEFKLLSFKVTAYDVGGGPRIRGIWKDYYAEIFGVVYVVDASDRERIADSRTVLSEALSDSRLSGKPFVVFANKQDIDGAMSEQDIDMEFELEQLAKKCESRYKVFQCTALLNEGRKIDSQLKKGLRWLLQTMNEDFASLKERVEKDVEIQKEAEKKTRAERLERVRKNRRKVSEKERAEREKEAAKNKETVDSDDEAVVFGNVLPRVKDLSKTKGNRTKKIEFEEENVENVDENVEQPESQNVVNEWNTEDITEEPLSENIHQLNESENQAVTKKKRKKKKKAKRNQTVPSDDGENSDAGIVLKPIAWRGSSTPLNGFPGNGRKLEPIRAPLHNSEFENSLIVCFNTGSKSDDPL
ncbi:ADP-ribosylation factor-like protein 13B [Dendronephthya gigantea]|uniref:ADP-ribosylation factor-like protein 13B n=1 Tax=Dendronephthya gigantea TaxID=151771 RepID=UPI00106CA560|nr:ADP-ribosylation factor-like protein 13B [Dendronephthya gigantea]